MFQVLSYLKFLLKSTNQHGVHSPFVFGLVTKCFYDQTNYTDYQSLHAYRKELLDNRETIQITDFGVGSKVFKSSFRAISKVARTSGTPLKRAKLLYRLARYLQCSSILELGTNLGIATHALALADQNASVTSIEGCSQLYNFTSNQLNKHSISNCELINSNFKEALKHLDQTYDLIFVDGDHSKESTLYHFNQLLDTVDNNSVIIFDDIHWSKDMTAAWETIKSHAKVTVSIDTFYWGFVFFRTEQVKEHFTIRL